jgi:hypothetical protein
MRRTLFLLALGLLGVAAGTSVGRADIIVYNATWSGAELGNSATATGQITVDTSLVSNPGFNSFFTPPGSPGEPITNVALTISGASSGNGSFTNSDFNFYVFDWNTAMNLNAELMGQPQDFGGPWGTHEGQPGFSGSHDFNLFAANPGAPTGTFYYRLTANGGQGDSMFLTSFAPAAAAETPEPMSLAVFGALGLCGLAVRRVRRTVG